MQRRRPAKKVDEEHEKSGKWRKTLNERPGMLRRDGGAMMIVTRTEGSGEGETIETATSAIGGLKIAVSGATGLDTGAGAQTGVEATNEGKTKTQSKGVDQGNAAEVRKQGVAAGVRQDIMRIPGEDVEEAK